MPSAGVLDRASGGMKSFDTMPCMFSALGRQFIMPSNQVFGLGRTNTIVVKAWPRACQTDWSVKVDAPLLPSSQSLQRRHDFIPRPRSDCPANLCLVRRSKRLEDSIASCSHYMRAHIGGQPAQLAIRVAVEVDHDLDANAVQTRLPLTKDSSCPFGPGDGRWTTSLSMTCRATSAAERIARVPLNLFRDPPLPSLITHPSALLLRRPPYLPITLAITLNALSGVLTPSQWLRKS
nr:hypothetical protein CFP56_08117 [Quercus suber]